MTLQHTGHKKRTLNPFFLPTNSIKHGQPVCVYMTLFELYICLWLYPLWLDSVEFLAVFFNTCRLRGMSFSVYVR